MNKTIASILFAFTIHFSAFSQRELTQADTALTTVDTLGKYELGVNTFFALDRLLDQNLKTPLELLVRKRIAPNRAVRLRAFGDLQHSTKVEGNFTDEVRLFSYGVAIGYEWIKPIHSRWEGYYGLELEGSQSRSLVTQTRMGHDPNVDPSEYWERDHTHQHTSRLALAPLAGVRFLLSQRLVLSTEFRLVGTKEWQDIGDEYSTKPLEGNPDFIPQTSHASSLDQRGIRFKPYTGVFLNYRF